MCTFICRLPEWVIKKKILSFSKEIVENYTYQPATYNTN